MKTLIDAINEYERVARRRYLETSEAVELLRGEDRLHTAKTPTPARATLWAPLIQVVAEAKPAPGLLDEPTDAFTKWHTVEQWHYTTALLAFNTMNTAAREFCRQAEPAYALEVMNIIRGLEPTIFLPGRHDAMPIVTPRMVDDDALERLRWIAETARPTKPDSAPPPGPHPDGPEEPNALWINGERHALPPVLWRMARVMWDKHSMQTDAFENEVWGEGGAPAEASVKSGISKLNAHLSEVGAIHLMCLSRKNGYVVNDAR